MNADELMERAHRFRHGLIKRGEVPMDEEEWPVFVVTEHERRTLYHEAFRYMSMPEAMGDKYMGMWLLCIPDAYVRRVDE